VVSLTGNPVPWATSRSRLLILDGMFDHARLVANHFDRCVRILRGAACVGVSRRAASPAVNDCPRPGEVESFSDVPTYRLTCGMPAPALLSHRGSALSSPPTAWKRSPGRRGGHAGPPANIAVPPWPRPGVALAQRGGYPAVSSPPAFPWPVRHPPASLTNTSHSQPRSGPGPLSPSPVYSAVTASPPRAPWVSAPLTMEMYLAVK